MTRRVRVRPIHRRNPELGLYVLALIELARQLQEEETRQGRVPDEIAEPGARS